MRLGLPRALITINHCTLLLLLLLLLPPVAQTAAQFGSLLHRDKTIRAGGLETLQSWFSVVTAGTTGTTSVCSLSFTSDLVTIITSQVDCKEFTGSDNSASNNSTISTQSWTFYHTIGSSLYRADSLLTLAVSSGASTILQLSVCLSPACPDGGDGGQTICLSSPHQHNYPTSSASHRSSSPEGFVFAIAGPSSSSMYPAITTTTPSQGPEVQPVEAEQSSASVMSFLSSYPEGFVMAFTPEESSSVSAFSSTAEGFVFAFANNRPSSSQPASH